MQIFLFFGFAMPFIHTEASGKRIQCRELMRGFFGSPVVSMMLGLILGCIPEIDSYVFDEDAPLRFLFDALLTFAYIGIYLPLIFLGANLYHFRKLKRPFSKTYLVSIIVCKLVISPILVTAYFAVLKQVTNIGENMPLAYVAFIAAIAPCTAVIVAVAQMFNWATNEISVIIFYVYVCCVPSIILFSYAFFLIMMY